MAQYLELYTFISSFPRLPFRGAQVILLVRELGSHMSNNLIDDICENLFPDYVLFHSICHIYHIPYVSVPSLIKIIRRNINNLRYADDTTLMAESEEELKSLLMKVIE